MSSQETVSGAISDWAATQFSFTVYESTGVVCADESTGHLWNIFGDDF